MSFNPRRLNALLIESGQRGKHLFGIVTDRCRNDSHLLLNFSSIRAGKYYDPTCIVEPGEHPFIRHRSFVNYGQARILAAPIITAKIQKQIIILHPSPITDGLATRMCDGILASAHTIRFVIEYYESL
jgi:hypothetical protein